MEIKNEHGRLVLRDRAVVATVDGPVWFGHLGCKRLGTLVEERKGKARKAAKVPGAEVPAPLPEELLSRWDSKAPGWRQAGKKGAATSVGKALGCAAERAQMRGVELWDTMRGGSDYWRGGKLLSEAGSALRSDAAATFASDDKLCPPSHLLEAFRHRNPEMTFAEYAEAYAAWLLEDHHLDLALAAVIVAQARSRLAVFYCTDPFIPGYADGAEWLSVTPFSARRWPLSALLREEGCHRIVLAELLARRFRELGVAGYVLEVDPTREDATALSF